MLGKFHGEGIDLSLAPLQSRRLILRTLLGTSFLALSSVPAIPDGCVTSGSTVSCTGNLALPITLNDISGLSISDLAGNLVPPGGTSVAVVRNRGGTGAAAGSLSIAFDDAGAGWSTDTVPGLDAFTGGGAGTNGSGGPATASGGTGGGGAATSISVNAASIIIADGDTAAVLLNAVAGNGGSANMQPVHPDNDNVTGGAAGAGGGFDGVSPAASVRVTAQSMTISGDSAGVVVSVAGGSGGPLDPDNLTHGQNNTTGSAGGAGGSGGDIVGMVQLGQVTLNQAVGGGGLPRLFRRRRQQRRCGRGCGL